MSQSTNTELTSQLELQEKMYRLGYEDAKNNREFGESVKAQPNKFTYNKEELEQLTLF